MDIFGLMYLTFSASKIQILVLSVVYAYNQFTVGVLSAVL